MSMPKIADFRRATILRDTPRFTAYEHPICGDESPIALRDKRTGEVIEDTPFWDADDVDAITAYLDELAPAEATAA